MAELARVRALADRGELEAAARACEALLARERLDPAPALLLAAIHQERGDLGAARRALRHALYLAPDSPVAHFVLGSVLRRQGERLRSHRAMRSVIDLLAGWPPEVPVPGAEGLTAGRLREAAEAALASRRAGRGLPIGGRGGGGRGG